MFNGLSPKLYFLHSTDPCLNLAVEELLARNASEPVFMLWRNEPSIIIGVHQNTAAEINADYVHEHGIHVVRRMTGGGAVYHDLGNVNYSCISLEREWGPESAAVFTAPIVAALEKLEIDAAFSGRNDILANGLKVSGCARSVPRDHTLFHGTLLFDADLDILSSALKPDPEKIKSRGIASVRARVGNLRDMLPGRFASMTRDDFAEYLATSIEAYFGQDNTFADIPGDLRREAENLAEQKYRTWEWNFGTRLDYQVVNKLRCPGGIVQAEFNVVDNHITDLIFSGDFLGMRPITELVEALRGTVPEKTQIAKRLSTIPFQDYIAGITLENLAALLAVD